ncbi:HypC/HybG/HupF family hydrogenase formation chaperone [Hydrogenophaga sp. 5NK40-0174]|uniref:HypC/HybG/HupF family hydrogenase formation chaperone n=1 Tax=Hydrogenophaga sp. 5NK40-0174 TaxID=3127649 RepID=UPI0031072513
MCIGTPMQVRSIEGSRHAVCEGRGQQRKVNTALVGEVRPGDWLLIFMDDAREAITADRAAEVNAALDLVEGAMSGLLSPANAQDDTGFALPSQMSAEQMKALTSPHAPPLHVSLPPEGAESP